MIQKYESTMWKSSNSLLKESDNQEHRGKTPLGMKDFSNICRAYYKVKDYSGFTTPHIADIMDEFIEMHNISTYDWNILDTYTIEVAEFLNKHRFPYSTRDSEGTYDFVPKYEDK